MAQKKPMIESAAPAADKKKALETCLAQLDKTYGKGTVMRLGENAGVVYRQFFLRTESPRPFGAPPFSKGGFSLHPLLPAFHPGDAVPQLAGMDEILNGGHHRLLVAGVVVDSIPTGSLSLDIALGIGGVPKGRIIEVYGPESSGKTTLALHIVAEAQKRGPYSFHCPLKRTFPGGALLSRPQAAKPPL